MRSFFAALFLSLLLAVPAYAAGSPAPQQQMTGNDVVSIIKQAQQGSGFAQYQLGVMLLIGQGVKKDPYNAAKWLLRAANQGVANAQFELAKLQIAGNAPGGKTAAFKWLLLSAGKDPDRIALCNKVEADLQPELAEVIKKQAASWKPTREEIKFEVLKRGQKME